MTNIYAPLYKNEPPTAFERIVVTERDIKEGTPRNHLYCPLALAIRRRNEQLPPADQLLEVNVSHRYISLYAVDPKALFLGVPQTFHPDSDFIAGYEIETGANLTMWLRDFDNYGINERTSKPFTVTFHIRQYEIYYS